MWRHIIVELWCCGGRDHRVAVVGGWPAVAVLVVMVLMAAVVVDQNGFLFLVVLLGCVEND